MMIDSSLNPVSMRSTLFSNGSMAALFILEVYSFVCFANALISLFRFLRHPLLRLGSLR